MSFHIEPQVNILLVDDQAANLQAVEAVLEPLGQHLVKARSGEEALRSADHGRLVALHAKENGPLWQELRADLAERHSAVEHEDLVRLRNC